MNPTPRTPRLVLVTRRATAALPLPDLAVRAIQGGVDLIQIREPDLSDDAFSNVVEDVVDAVKDSSKLMVNGRPNVARRFGIGLHLPESLAERWTGDRTGVTRLSRAVHRESKPSSAGEFDFAIAGHVFATNSKPGIEPLGDDCLTQLTRRWTIPLLAIGGITPDRVATVLAAGAAGVAVMSAINDSAEPEIVAAAFRRELETVSGASPEKEIAITVNGKPATTQNGISIQAFLESRGHHERMVVVELNGEILRRHVFEDRTISAGDKIEIVHFVGGG